MSRLVLLATVLLLAGCGITVLPQQTPLASLDAGGKAITASAGGVQITAQVQDLEVAPYRLQNNVTSFYLTLANNSAQPLTVPREAFLIVDDRGRQYAALAPSAVLELTRRDSEYLIPYPYVGYYYLEDRELATQTSQMDLDRPLEARPSAQNVLLEALPVQALAPQARLTGMIYFPIDLYAVNAFELRVYLHGLLAGAAPDIVFPFVVKR